MSALRRAWLLAPLLCGACPPRAPAAAPPAAPPAASDALAPDAPEAHDTAPRPLEADAPPPESAGAPRCLVEALPAPPPPAPPAPCADVPAALRPRAEALLARDFRPSAPGARLEVRFDCDPLSAPFELVHESGRGHAPRLTLTRLRWREKKIEALRLRGGPELSVERGELARGALDLVLPELRALALAQLAERRPPDAGGSSGYGSSQSWFGLLRLTDPEGRAIERGFAGADASTTQLESLPTRAIAARLDHALDRVAWQPAPVDADARAFFVERYLAASPQHQTWWIRERLVALAAAAGTPALVPSLIAAAADTSTDASAARTRDLALAALAALAGFDARQDPNGAPHSEAEAVAAYAAACAPP